MCLAQKYYVCTKKAFKYEIVSATLSSFKSLTGFTGGDCRITLSLLYFYVEITNHLRITGPRSAVGNVSGNRCESDCR